MAVLARNKITGLIGSVSEGNLRVNPNLVLATEEEIVEDKRVKHLKVFGYLPDETPEPEVPNMKWSRERLLAVAANKKIEVDDTITKRELVAALTEGDK